MNALQVLKQSLVTKKLIMYENYINETCYNKTFKPHVKAEKSIRVELTILDVIDETDDHVDAYGTNFQIVTKDRNLHLYFGTEFELLE